MEEHFKRLWDLVRSIPSLESEGASVLDGFQGLDQDDPKLCLQRARVNPDEQAHTDGLFRLSEQAQKANVKLFLAASRPHAPAGAARVSKAAPARDPLVVWVYGLFVENSGCSGPTEQVTLQGLLSRRVVHPAARLHQRSLVMTSIVNSVASLGRSRFQISLQLPVATTSPGKVREFAALPGSEPWGRRG